MKVFVTRWLRCLFILGLPGSLHAQLTYSINNGAITITGYVGKPGVLIIPCMTNGYPVTSIADRAFQLNSTLTNLTIPDSVTNIGVTAFGNCPNLTNVVIGNGVTSYGGGAFWQSPELKSATIGSPITGAQSFSQCFSLRTVTFLGGVTSIGQQAFYQCTNLDKVTLPNSVTNLGPYAFAITGITRFRIPDSVVSCSNSALAACSSLTNLTIGKGLSVVSGVQQFAQCGNLTHIYFTGDANPTLVGISAFEYDTNAIVYYLPGTKGWGPTYEGLSTVMWNPKAQNDSSFGVQNNQFGFNITGNSNLIVIVEVCTDLANPAWSPVSTNTLNTMIGTNGTSFFSDPQWTNYPSRFYGFSWP